MTPELLGGSDCGMGAEEKDLIARNFASTR